MLLPAIMRFFPTSRQSNRSGLSMIEVLIVVAILGILFVIVMTYLNNTGLPRARDAERKDDLHEIKIAFEEYYNDNGCYPPQELLKNCGSSDLSPYINELPCDPLTEDPYVYVPHPSESDTCGGYRVYSPIEWSGDPVIEDLGCVDGCGLTNAYVVNYGINTWDGEDYQYGISEGVPIGSPVGDPELSSGYCCAEPDADPPAQCQAWDEGSGACDGQGPFETEGLCYENSNCEERN